MTENMVVGAMTVVAIEIVTEAVKRTATEAEREIAIEGVGVETEGGGETGMTTEGGRGQTPGRGSTEIGTGTVTEAEKGAAEKEVGAGMHMKIEFLSIQIWFGFFLQGKKWAPQG